MALLNLFQLLVDNEAATSPGETPSGTDWMPNLDRLDGSYLLKVPKVTII